MINLEAFRFARGSGQGPIVIFRHSLRTEFISTNVDIIAHKEEQLRSCQ